jgi:hypothetical protein
MVFCQLLLFFEGSADLAGTFLLLADIAPDTTTAMNKVAWSVVQASAHVTGWVASWVNTRSAMLDVARMAVAMLQPKGRNALPFGSLALALLDFLLIKRSAPNANATRTLAAAKAVLPADRVLLLSITGA